MINCHSGSNSAPKTTAPIIKSSKPSNHPLIESAQYKETVSLGNTLPRTRAHALTGSPQSREIISQRRLIREHRPVIKVALLE
jgi:hypothetical protein